MPLFAISATTRESRRQPVKKRLLAGILLGGILLYFSLKDLDFHAIAEGVQHIRYVYVAGALFILFIMQILRSYRWGVLLSPIEQVDQISLFSITSVGFMLIVAIPARIGEFARPYLITRKSTIKMSSALGSIVLERVFDFLAIILLLPLVMFFTPLPPWLVKSGILLLLTVAVTLCLFILLVVKKMPSMDLVHALLKRLPDRLSMRLEGAVTHFIEGFRAIERPRLFAYIFFLSLLIWLADVLSIYAMFFALGFNLSFMAALTVMIILIFGLIVPTAPGFVGNWHYFTMIGLLIFGISKTDAMTFAIVHHALCITLTVTLGLIFLPSNTLNISKLKDS